MISSADTGKRPCEGILMFKSGIARAALVFAAFAAFSIATAPEGFSQMQAQTTLFKVVTEKDDIIIGLNAEELQAVGKNAGAIAQALADKKALTLWRYSVGKSAAGDLQLAPLHQIGLLASHSLRVEPYSSPLPVLPHD
jgi:hypothetical protein